MLSNEIEDSLFRNPLWWGRFFGPHLAAELQITILSSFFSSSWTRFRWIHETSPTAAKDGAPRVLVGVVGGGEAGGGAGQAWFFPSAHSNTKSLSAHPWLRRGISVVFYQRQRASATGPTHVPQHAGPRAPACLAACAYGDCPGTCAWDLYPCDAERFIFFSFLTCLIYFYAVTK